MAEVQMGMFEDDERLNALIDHLDRIPEDELKKSWPKMLFALVEVVSAELRRQGLEPAEAGRLARKTIAAQAGYMGGRAYYLPMGESLFAELRNHEIYSRWSNRERIENLRREYRMSETQIYAIIREQHKRHRRRIQPDMFDANHH
ncbi:transcriptional regulator [Salmonella enterica]|nr:transcriptional regulator [Salmonella enterica]ECE0702683.1 transcriptional regulator [Salmonella enterica]ECK0244968.1 transcriptional regulator [Salmonella enterica]ECW1604524.1 transcriptional regulator [Salmonella enterica]EDC5950064.1 transcriptional regulator [Salmonella enterica]